LQAARPDSTTPGAPLPTTEYLTAHWRHAHWEAVGHLIASLVADCGCTAVRLCNEGQALDDIAADAERRLALVERRWA
jgi:hypothetical protein